MVLVVDGLMIGDVVLEVHLFGSAEIFLMSVGVMMISTGHHMPDFQTATDGC